MTHTSTVCQCTEINFVKVVIMGICSSLVTPEVSTAAALGAAKPTNDFVVHAHDEYELDKLVKAYGPGGTMLQHDFIISPPESLIQLDDGDTESAKHEARPPRDDPGEGTESRSDETAPNLENSMPSGKKGYKTKSSSDRKRLIEVYKGDLSQLEDEDLLEVFPELVGTLQDFTHVVAEVKDMQDAVYFDDVYEMFYTRVLLPYKDCTKQDERRLLAYHMAKIGFANVAAAYYTYIVDFEESNSLEGNRKGYAYSACHIYQQLCIISDVK